MCGIIGTAGNLQAVDEKIFTELLYVDVVRGKHATGVATVKGQCRSVEIHKRALPAALYLELGSTTKHLDRFIRNTVALGHNRHATKGNSSDPEGAHPFQHDHITLVHNGSLTSHHELTEESFTVDSEAICKAISVDGIEVVGPKLRGAFALVWIDSEKNTLNFFRNSERSFAIAWNSTSNRMWWASEKGMLEWSLNRDTFLRNPVNYDTCFELPVGKHISIPITHVGVDIANREEQEIDVSNSVYVYTGYRQPYTPKAQSTPEETAQEVLRNQAVEGPRAGETVTKFAFGNQREDALKKLSTQLVEEKGKNHFAARAFISTLDMTTDAAILDERIGFFITEWEPYASTSPHLGTMTGVMMEFPYTTIKIHSIREQEYEELYLLSDGMATSYIQSLVCPTTGITIQSGSVVEEADLQSFELILRKDAIRCADLDDFWWDVNKVPKEDSKVTLKTSKSTEVAVLDTPTNPCRTFELKDGTQVSPKGSAIFIGTEGTLKSDTRHQITKVAINEATGNVLLTAKVGDTYFSYNSDKWKMGILSKEALDNPQVFEVKEEA